MTTIFAYFHYISAMFLIHRGVPTPFFFSPSESFMGLFMFSLLDFGSTYETFEGQELSHLLKVKECLEKKTQAAKLSRFPRLATFCA